MHRQRTLRPLVRSASAAAIVIATLTLAPGTPASAATAKVGAKCTRAGAVSGTLSCTKKAGSLVWARAVAGAPTTPAGIDGSWKATGQSVVGYRVKEVINGQSGEAVGRTSGVTGSLTIAGTKATAAALTIDVTTLKSNESRRDGQVQGRIMQTSQFPTATLKLLSPVDFAAVPQDKQPVTARAKVSLTLRGVTKPVEVDIAARRNGALLEVQGAIAIVFADWGIPNPSFASIKTEDHGTLEFLVVFGR